jgi:hypothetical protein
MSAKQTILTELRKLQALQAALDPANDPFSTSSLLSFFITAIDMQLVDKPLPPEPPSPEEPTSTDDQILTVAGSRFRCACLCNVFRESTTTPHHYKCNACGSWHTATPDNPSDEDIDPEILDAANNHGQGDTE